MGQAENEARRPRAVVHRRILDVAESRPDASPSAIADQVSGATVDLVENVLTEYGDPGTEATHSDDAGTEATHSDDADESDTTQQSADATADDVSPDSSDRAMTDDKSRQMGASASKDNGESRLDLSEKQRRALRYVHEYPDASQADIAAELDVTRATVSRWLNDIPGFEWDEREAFAASVFEDADSIELTDSGSGAESADSDADVETADQETDADQEIDPATDLDRRLDDLAERVDRLETDSEDEAGISIDADLAHRVVHACMESDRISEDEELELLAAFMDDTP